MNKGNQGKPLETSLKLPEDGNALTGGKLRVSRVDTSRGSSINGRQLVGGFSLTEVLVVAAIIAVLVALIFPNMQNMRDKANSAKCISNLKGIASAIFMSAGENNGKWVFLEWKFDSWSNKLVNEGFLSSRGSTYCPSLVVGPVDPPFTYGVNWFAVAAAPDDAEILEDTNENGGGPRNYGAFRLKSIQHPSKFSLLADSHSPRGYILGGQFHLVQPGGYDAIHMRHSNRSNVLFADGHVGALGTEELREIGWNAAFNEDFELERF